MHAKLVRKTKFRNILLRKDDITVQNVTIPASPASRLERLFPPVEESSTILLACPRGDYRASSRIIAELRVSHRNPESVGRSLERYGYEVVDAEGAPLADDSLMRSRYDELMHYLGI